MNRNNYQLNSSDFILNERADNLMNNICFLANERNYKNHFPLFSTINFQGIDEEELIQHIEELEQIHSDVIFLDGSLPHKAHPYLLDEDCKIYHNDTEYGTDINNSAPICGGKTPIEALKIAWKKWSIPPVLILNADYYVPGVSISEVI